MSKQTYVVDLRHAPTKRKDTKYVRAESEAGAIRTAKAHSFLPPNAAAAVRLATPADLECVPITAVYKQAEGK